MASDNRYCPKATNKEKVVGIITSRMEAIDDSFGFNIEDIYDEVIEHIKVTYCMQDGRQVTTVLKIPIEKHKLNNF